MKEKITKESLIKFGMVETDNPMHPLKKDIGESDIGKLSIVVTRAYNTDQFAIIMPNGGTLYIAPRDMKDLRIFEAMVLGYEPDF